MHPHENITDFCKSCQATSGYSPRWQGVEARTHRRWHKSRKTRTRIHVYVNIDPQRIIYLLWTIFLDARKLFSVEVQLGDTLTESQLLYKNKYQGGAHFNIYYWGNSDTIRRGPENPQNRNSEQGQQSVWYQHIYTSKLRTLLEHTGPR